MSTPGILLGMITPCKCPAHSPHFTLTLFDCTRVMFHIELLSDKGECLRAMQSMLIRYPRSRRSLNACYVGPCN